MYKVYDEDGYYMRLVKRKEEAMHFVKYYGWTIKYFRQPKKKKSIRKIRASTILRGIK